MRTDLGCSIAVVIGVALVSSIFVPCAFSQTPGSISGTITGDDGKPLAALVTANRTTPPAASGRAEAGKDGVFTITKLPAGAYTLCASVKGGGYLDPCAWSTTPPTAQLAASQAVAGYKLVVNQGTTVQVRLNDPGKLLGTAPVPKKVTPHVLLGVFTSRRLFQPLGLISKDNNGRNHQATIPIDTPISLYITGRGLQITDETGAVVPTAGLTKSVMQGKGGNPKVITFNISNPNKP